VVDIFAHNAGAKEFLAATQRRRKNKQITAIRPARWRFAAQKKTLASLLFSGHA
jgi:hypothetical protein